MPESPRRLAAILIADLVGYSRMVAEDADGTLAAVRAHRNALDPLVLNRGGRIVKGTGDGFMAEFSSAVAAVETASAIQRTMRERGSALPESRRMLLRIGINLGDIVDDESGDVLGDGVNVAARVEPLSPPGGVAITDAVMEAIRGKSQLDLVDAGDHELKNIDRPVRIWTWGGEDGDRPSAENPSQPRLAAIAVMPFENMSRDLEQEYFSDGITEDLITALSYDRDLGVVARNSTFAYKGRGVDVRTVARDVDATHIVEGSVRRASGRIRVTAQLIDAESGLHIWAERYDREMADVFDLQDELVESITTKVRPTLRDGATRRQASRETAALDAWDLTLRGWFHVNKHTTDGFLEGLDLFDRAAELDPGFVRAPAGAAMAWMMLAIRGWRGHDVNPWKRAGEAAGIAQSLDPDDYDALISLSGIKSLQGDTDEGNATPDGLSSSILLRPLGTTSSAFLCHSPVAPKLRSKRRPRLGGWLATSLGATTPPTTLRGVITSSATTKRRHDGESKPTLSPTGSSRHRSSSPQRSVRRVTSDPLPSTRRRS